MFEGVLGHVPKIRFRSSPKEEEKSHIRKLSACYKKDLRGTYIFESLIVRRWGSGGPRAEEMIYVLNKKI